MVETGEVVSQKNPDSRGHDEIAGREVLLRFVSPDLRGLDGMLLSFLYFMDVCNKLKKSQL